MTPSPAPPPAPSAPARTSGSARDLMLSPGFFDQPEQKQIEALSAIHPGFRALAPEKQKQALTLSRGFVQHPTVQGAGAGGGAPQEPSYGQEIAKGLEIGSAGIYKIGANVTGAGGHLDNPVSRFLRAQQTELEKSAAAIPEGKTFGKQLAQKIPEVVVGSLPMLATGGSPIGMAAVGAAEKLDKGIVPAVQGGMQGWAYGKALPWISGGAEKILGRAVPAAYAGPAGVGAAQALYGAVSGQSSAEIIANALEGAALGGVAATRGQGKPAGKAAAKSAKAKAVAAQPPAAAPEVTAAAAPPAPPTPVGVPPEVAPAAPAQPATPVGPTVTRSTVSVGGRDVPVTERTAAPGQISDIRRAQMQRSEYQRALAASKSPDAPAPAQSPVPVGPMSAPQIEQRIAQLQDEQSASMRQPTTRPVGDYDYKSLANQPRQLSGRAAEIEQEIQSLQGQLRQMDPALGEQHQAYRDKIAGDIKWIGELRDGMDPASSEYGSYTKLLEKKQAALRAAGGTVAASQPAPAAQAQTPVEPTPAQQPAQAPFGRYAPPSMPTPGAGSPVPGPPPLPEIPSSLETASPTSPMARFSQPQMPTPGAGSPVPGPQLSQPAQSPPEFAPTGMAGFRTGLPVPAAGAPPQFSNQGAVPITPGARGPQLQAPAMPAPAGMPPLPEGAPPAVDLSHLEPVALLQSAGLTPPAGGSPPQAFREFASQARAAFREQTAGASTADPETEGAMAGALQKLNQYLKPYEDAANKFPSAGTNSNGPAPTPQMQAESKSIFETIRAKILNAKDIKVTVMDASGKPLGSQEFPIDTDPTVLAQVIASVPGAQRVQYGPGSQTQSNVKGSYYKFLNPPAASPPSPPPGPVGPK